MQTFSQKINTKKQTVCSELTTNVSITLLKINNIIYTSIIYYNTYYILYIVIIIYTSLSCTVAWVYLLDRGGTIPTIWYNILGFLAFSADCIILMCVLNGS